MKPSFAFQFALGTALIAGAGPALSATDMATAKSLQKSAQTGIGSLKSGQTSSPHGMALQAQKATADWAVQAHESAAKAQEEATKAQQAAEEWTSHAQTMSQAAQKIGGVSTATTIIPGNAAKAAADIKSAIKRK